jgi:hypothetical protein
MRLPHVHILALAIASLTGAAAAETSQGRTPSADTLLAEARSAAPVGDGALAAMTGGAGPLVMSEQTLSAVVTGNTVNADTVNTGAVTLSSNAFSGFSGIGNFVINTGNNNNLQGSLSVNIVMTPAP